MKIRKIADEADRVSRATGSSRHVVGPVTSGRSVTTSPSRAAVTGRTGSDRGGSVVTDAPDASYSYEVVVTREGSNWLADVPALPGTHTWARSLAALRHSARDAIVLMADLDDDADVELVLRLEVDDTAVSTAAQVATDRAELAEREAVVHTATARAVDSLTRRGFTVRDTAELLGITPGRVSQIATRTH